MQYGWRPGCRLTGDAQAVGEALEALEGKNAQGIVNAAKAKRSPLHTYFEWDDAVAGPLYRLEQARLLTRSVVIVREDGAGESNPRAFHYVREDTDSEDDEGMKVITTYARVRAVPQLFQQVVGELRRDLASARHRLLDFDDRSSTLVKQLDRLDKVAERELGKDAA